MTALGLGDGHVGLASATHRKRVSGVDRADGTENRTARVMDDATLEKANEDKFILSGPNDDSKINVNIIGEVKNFEKVNVSFHNALVLENESLEINVSDMKVDWY